MGAAKLTIQALGQLNAGGPLNGDWTYSVIAIQIYKIWPININGAFFP